MKTPFMLAGVMAITEGLDGVVSLPPLPVFSPGGHHFGKAPTDARFVTD